MSSQFYRAGVLGLLAMSLSGHAAAQDATEEVPRASDSPDDSALAVGDSSVAQPVTPPAEPEALAPAEEQQASLDEQANEQAARDAFRKGDRLFLEGDYKGAVAAFEEAYALSGRIEMLFNLANAHERLGNYEAASVALRGYIPHSPQSQRPALERRLARFEERTEEKEEAAAQKAKDHAALEEAGQSFPVDRAAGIGLLTLGGAGLIVGTAFSISAAGARSELKDICVSQGGTLLCPSDAENLVQRDKTHSLVADIAFISGAALAAGGFYLVLRSNDDLGDEGVEVRASAGPGSLFFTGSF